MNQNWNRIIELFYEYSNESFSVREIAKMSKIPSSTAQRYLETLKKVGVIGEGNRPKINSFFKFKKSSFLIEKIHSSGLLDYLIVDLKPSCVVLFGSARKGEYDKDSDIDLFVESTSKKDVDLKIYEKRIGHNVHLFVNEDIKKLPEDLLNNVINGIKLMGYIKLK